MLEEKKSWLEIASGPAPLHLLSYTELVPIVMMSVMVVNPMPVPVVRRSRRIAIVSMRSVVSIRIIAVAIRIITVVITVPVSRITESDSHTPDAN
jgi:hypothetical protein